MKKKRMVPIAAVVLSIAAAGTLGPMLAANGQTHHAATRAAQPATQWFISASEYQKHYASSTTHSDEQTAASPATTSNGPIARNLEQALTPYLAPYIASTGKTQDIGSGAQAGATVTWKAKNGGFLAASTQKLTRPLPIQYVGGDNTTAVHDLSSGTQYIIIDRSPVLIQLITVRSDGTQVQVTFGATRPQGQPLPTETDMEHLAATLDKLTP